jgi:hypothetical protein
MASSKRKREKKVNWLISQGALVRIPHHQNWMEFRYSRMILQPSLRLALLFFTAFSPKQEQHMILV